MSARGTKLPRRGPWLALGSAVIIVCLAWVVHPRVLLWRAASRTEEELRALASCLLPAGTDPREADDGGLRRRAIEASLAGADWPARCTPHAAAADVALGLREASCSGDPQCEALARTRALLSAVRDALAAARFEDGTVASLFAQAAEIDVRIAAQPVEGPGFPKPEFPPLEARDVTPLYVGAPAERLLDPARSHELRLAFHEPQRRAKWCALDAKKARCMTPPASVPLDAVLALPAGDANAPPMMLAVKERAVSLHHLARGTELGLDGDEAHVHVARDGRVHAAVHDDAGWSWVNGDERQRLPGLEHVVLSADSLLWTRVDQGERALVQTDGTTRLLAALPSDVAPLSCATPSTTALLFARAPKGFETQATLVFVKGRSPASVVETRVASRWFGFTCHGDHADLTWIEAESEERSAAPGPSEGAIAGSYRVARMRCRTSGCALEQRSVELERHRKSSRYIAASLGDAVALLWRSPFGDVRLRVAPLASLPTARDRSVFDDAAHGGFEFDDGDTELFVRGDTGYLLLETEQADRKRAVHALAIGADGRVTPLAAPQGQ